MLTDYHIHPDYSMDALPISIDRYCERAVELGLREICFTTHFELDPLREQMDNFVIYKGKKHPVSDYRWLDGYLQEIQDAGDSYESDGLAVKAGVEIGYDLGLGKEVEKVVEAYPFDFVLGSVHCLDHTAISSMEESPKYFSTHSLSQTREDYFNILNEAVETGLFHCIAHIDLYRRYGYEYYGPNVNTIHRGVIEGIFKEMAHRGMGLEVNTSARRRGFPDFHPSEEILSMAVKAGVEVYTVGSDAHRLEDLGCGIEDALELLNKYGVHNHIFYQGRAVPLIEGMP
ncbi:MAG: histidinol-phosphatase HisJ family protein [Clostridia bacterium]|nr:histidinol-phosphatase HisJ family protein [Clostridia bacterium]